MYKEEGKTETRGKGRAVSLKLAASGDGKRGEGGDHLPSYINLV